MPRQNSTPPRSILVVDNDRNLRRSLGLVLKRAGYAVLNVGRACEALEYLESGFFSLVILDLVMVDNRLTLLPTILRLYPHLPILVFTADWSPETANEIEQLGIRAHLIKPITPKILLECVEKILQDDHRGEHHEKP
jgi:DNA-binding NtrC family response regulator